MRIAFAVVGSLFGFLLTWEQTRAVRAVFAVLGVVLGLALSGILPRRRGKSDSRSREVEHEAGGLAPPQRESIDNYWIEKGRLDAAPGYSRAEDPEALD